MTTGPHPADGLVDYVDGRLTPAGEAEVRAHLADCASCRALHGDLVAARAAAAVLRVDAPMPADLEAALSRALDSEDGPRAMAAPPRSPGRPVSVHVAWRVAVGTAVAAALVGLYLRIGSVKPAPDLPTAVVLAVAAVEAGSVSWAVQAEDAAVIEAFFRGSPGPRARVFDLAMMDITLVGGTRTMLAGRPSALYAYRLPSGASLLCEMFEGRLDDLPPPAETRADRGFRFHVYTRQHVTMVFWQEGDLVCVLAASLPAEEVLALARAKAMAPQ